MSAGKTKPRPFDRPSEEGYRDGSGVFGFDGTDSSVSWAIGSSGTPRPLSGLHWRRQAACDGALPLERRRVFPRRRGGLLPIEEYRREFDKACAEVGIEGLVPHGLRHTTASLAISAGANVKVVQRMLGHATAAMILDRYGHLLDDDPSGVAEALGTAMHSVAVPRGYAEPRSEGKEGVSAAS